MSWTGDLAQKITDNVVAREKQVESLYTDKEKQKAYLANSTLTEKIFSIVSGLILILIGISAIILHLFVITESSGLFVFMLLIAPVGYAIIVTGSLFIYYQNWTGMYLPKTSFKLSMISLGLSLIVFIGDFLVRGHFILNIFISFVLLITTITLYFRK